MLAAHAHSWNLREKNGVHTLAMRSAQQHPASTVLKTSKSGNPSNIAVHGKSGEWGARVSYPKSKAEARPDALFRREKAMLVSLRSFLPLPGGHGVRDSRRQGPVFICEPRARQTRGSEQSEADHSQQGLPCFIPAISPTIF